MVAMAVMMMAMGFGGGFGDAATDDKSCGANSQRRTRPGSNPQRQFLEFQHVIVPQESIAIFVASGTPVPFCVAAVCWFNEA